MSVSVVQRLALSDRSRAVLQDVVESLFTPSRTESGSKSWAPIIGGIAVTLLSIWLRRQSNQRVEGRRRGRRASNG
ncbi:MAG TPA: hypothetical protein ENN56_02600 [Firmicutes bacterium]|nr:hypothetical protein [Bacillota bacterium]